ncbi:MULTISPECIES: DsbA family protein [Rhodomicrobium]|uniref:DsbA family protein n=1 Tax=Rhodomicrobium TaxID=1068 RepID=UPI00148223F2|nr:MULTISPECIES: DsbA family protein [Rhodomicrobium]
MASLASRLMCFIYAAGLLTAATTAAQAEDVFPAPVARPAKPPSIAELNLPGPLGERSLGKATAPVTIIEYASLGCPVCAGFHTQILPKLKADYIDTGKVRLIYREFPIGKSSLAAAHAARCVAERHFFRINEKLMSNRGGWNAREPDPGLLYKIVQETGIQRAAFDSCMANQKTKDGLIWMKQRGRELGVKGTPSFFINGQPVRGVLNYEEMRRLIEQHLQSAS